MKHINISSYIKKSNTTLVSNFKKHSVFVDNNTWKHFTNKKEVEKFLAEQNRLFNLTLNEIIYLNFQIYSEFWLFWLENDNSGSRILNSFRDIEKWINNTINRAKVNNGDSIYFVRNNFNKIINELLDIVNEIISERQISNKHGNNRILKIYRNNLNILLDKILINKNPE